ncbi:MAG TPA: hypothetical protein VFY12_04520 [Arenimonas sp.]|nr:hypothetical protein [Arenimonas sp.]
MRAASFLLCAVFALPVLANPPRRHAVVILDDKAGELHAGISTASAYASAFEAVPQLLSQQFGSVAASTGEALAMGAGAALGGIIAGAIAAGAQQKAADEAIAPLTSLNSESARAARVRAGIEAVLLEQGYSDIDIIMAPDPSSKLLPNLRRAGSADLVVFIDNDAQDGYTNSLFTLTADNRSLRLAAKIEVLRRDGRRLAPVGVRRVNLFTPPNAADGSALALSDWVAAGGDSLLERIENAARRVVSLGLSEAPPGKAGKRETVAFVNSAGAFAVSGRLVQQAGQEIQVVDRRGNVAVFHADWVLPD